MLSRARVTLTPVDIARYARDNAKLARSELPRVIFFGDSRIHGWQPRPKCPGVQCIYRGIPGETTAQMRYRFADDVLRLDPAIVVIQAGINDLVAGAPLGRGPEAAAQVVSNLSAMTSTADGAGTTVILLTVIRPSKPELLRTIVWSDDIYSLVSDVNARLRNLATSGVKIFDADAILSQNQRVLPGK